MTLAGLAQWSSIGGTPLSGKQTGLLAQISPGIDSLTIVIEADLVSTPTARLLVGVDNAPTVANAIFALANGQAVTFSIPQSRIVTWGLVSSANLAINGGAQDYLRATGYI